GEGQPSTLWHELMEAQWVVVRNVERGGRRYLIARAADERTRERTRLSNRERTLLARRLGGEALKVIATDLGLRDSTISRMLAEALRKLGLSSEAELRMAYWHPVER